MESIQVKVVEFRDRNHYQMQYRDPVTGRKKTRSTEIERTGREKERKQAERVAAKWEAELREGRYIAPSKTTWEDFREKYEREVSAALAENTDRKASGVFNAVERHLNPKLVRDINADRLSYLQSKLREEGRKEDTIASHMAHLQAALRFAVDWGMVPKLPKVPRIQRVKSGKSMKGRPITGEEFDRTQAKVAAALLAPRKQTPPVKTPNRKFGEAALAKLRSKRVQRAEAAASGWQYFMRGLWLSGLRLGESLELYWDRDDRLCVDMSGKHPMLRIPGALEKGHTDRLLPMAPEFAEFLLAVPEAQRRGPVFNPYTLEGKRPDESRASKVLSKAGELAGVKVKTDPKTRKIKYASAHDLRRSFGERWASRVMPQVLMQLMRHESIETTLKYYVGRNAESTAAVLWEAHRAAGNSSGNSQPAAAVNENRGSRNSRSAK